VKTRGIAACLCLLTLRYVTLLYLIASLLRQLLQQSDLESRADAKESSSAPGKPGRKKNPKCAPPTRNRANCCPEFLPAHRLRVGTKTASRNVNFVCANSRGCVYYPSRPSQGRSALPDTRPWSSSRTLVWRQGWSIGGNAKCHQGCVFDMHLPCTFRSSQCRVDLMAENQTLRTMLRNLASFIGDGMGGVLPKLGWDVNEFNTFVNKGETDTAWEGFQRRKKQMQQSQAEAVVAGSSSTASLQGHKRPSEDPLISGHSKKARGDEIDTQPPGFSDVMSPSSSSNGLYNADSRGVDRGGLFADMMRGTPSSGMFVQTPSPGNTMSYGGVSGNMSGYPSSYLGGMAIPPLNTGVPPPPNAYESQVPSSAQSRSNTLSTPASADEELDDDPNKSEAFKLIQYASQFNHSAPRLTQFTQLPSGEL